MDQMTIIAIQAVIQLIATVVVPLVTKDAATRDEINQVIDTIEKLIPILGNKLVMFASALKNIIAALSANPGTPQEQYDRLRALDAIVDAAADAAIEAVDPDKDDPGAPAAA